MIHTGKRILIVDDDPAILATLSLLSTTMGYRARSAEDGSSALRLIRQEPPDLLLSDVYMPGMSGFELLSIVRRKFPAIHTIAMSSAFSGTEVPTTVEADAFYEKATNLGVLLQLLHPCLPEKSGGSHPNNGAGLLKQSEFTLDS